MDESTSLLHNKNTVDGGSSSESKQEENGFDAISFSSKRGSSSRSSSECSAYVPGLYKTYWYRWYICLIFALMGMFQGAIWNTWGPIDESAEAAFGFSSNEIELLANWGPIAFLIFMPVFMWCLDNKGLRLSSVSTAFLVALGTGLRCLPLDAALLRYFIHAGQMLNGIAGCVVMAAPPYLSNLWFPPHERITATGVATLLNYMGTGVAYTVGMIVDVPSNFSKNHTECIHSNYNDTNNTCHEIVAIRQQITNILYVEFGLAMFVFISMLIFFPNRPPKPPSVSASLPRRSLKEGLLELRHHRQFWVVAMVMSLVIGTWSGWTGVMPIILKPLDISQSDSGLIGLIMSVVGSLTGMVVGWFTDRLKGRMRLMLTIIFSLTLIMFLYFIVMSNEWIKVVPFIPGKAEVWTVCIILGILMNASVPLGMEMAADAGYPVSEGTSTSIVVWLFNLLSFILLFVLGYLPNPLDSNYIIFACLIVSVPALIFFTSEENRRLELDTRVKNDDAATHKEYGTINPNYK